MNIKAAIRAPSGNGIIKSRKTNLNHSVFKQRAPIKRQGEEDDESGSIQKIIANAIKAEVEANKFYSNVSKKAKDAGMKRLFQELAEEEAQHKLTLKGYLAKGTEKIQFSESADYKVADELPTPPLTPDLKPVDGLVIAIKMNSRPCRCIPSWPKPARIRRRRKFFRSSPRWNAATRKNSRTYTPIWHSLKPGNAESSPVNQEQVIKNLAAKKTSEPLRF